MYAIFSGKLPYRRRARHPPDSAWHRLRRYGGVGIDREHVADRLRWRRVRIVDGRVQGGERDGSRPVIIGREPGEGGVSVRSGLRRSVIAVTGFFLGPRNGGT